MIKTAEETADDQDDDSLANAAADLAEKSKNKAEKKAAEVDHALKTAQSIGENIIGFADTAKEEAAIGSTTRDKAEKKYNEAVTAANENPTDAEALKSLLSKITKYSEKVTKAEGASNEAYLSAVSI